MSIQSCQDAFKHKLQVSVILLRIEEEEEQEIILLQSLSLGIVIAFLMTHSLDIKTTIFSFIQRANPPIC